MRRKLLFSIALAVLATAVTAALSAGTATVKAGPGLLDVGDQGVSVKLPGGDKDLQVVKPLPACSNLKDDDGDGKTDLVDPGCNGPLDDDEHNTPRPEEPPDEDPGITPPPPPPDGGDKGGGKRTGGGTKTDRTKTGGTRVKDSTKDERKPMRPAATRNADGTPTAANPTRTTFDFGPAPIGVPNFLIDSFTIPPFLLPIYQACGTQYEIPWQILASINRIETAFGTNLWVSSAGAVGWMQFLPSSWRAYGVDANADGRKDPYNPVDAICAAARYLRAAGGQSDLRSAIFAYNHADWYVDEVVLYARQYGRFSDDLVGSLTGLTDGRFPIADDATYADDISEREAAKRATSRLASAGGNAADLFESSPTRRGINIYSREGARVIAVNDGVIEKIGQSKRLGRYLILTDAYGNRFTYSQLGQISKLYPVAKDRRLDAKDFRLVTPKEDEAPAAPASAGSNKGGAAKQIAAKAATKAKASAPRNSEDSRPRLFAFPERPRNAERADLTGQLDSLLAKRFPGAYESVKSYLGSVLRFDRDEMELRKLREGSKVSAGTVLARIGESSKRLAPHLHFAIRPAGRGAPSIDPKVILDGWALLEKTAIYRAAGEDPFRGRASVGQILLMSKGQLQRRVLADPRLEIYSCGRQDVRAGRIDRRVLALLEYLATRGFRLTITSLECGHGFYTTSGSVSHHSSGNAVDIARINGISALGNQGRGSITEALVRDILKLQGTMAPNQVISLMDFGDSSFAMADHDDHVHVGYQPLYGPGAKRSGEIAQILKPGQWGRLIERIAEIDQPNVRTKPSRYAIPSKRGKGASRSRRASGAHVGE